MPEADTDAFESMVVTETSVVPIDYTVSYSLNLTVTPSSEANHYVNCTDVEFRCEAASNETDLFSAKPLSIWWTFQGINVSASTLPGGRVTNENNASVLSVSCAQFGIHNGEYQCHSAIGESGKTSKNITIEIDSKFLNKLAFFLFELTLDTFVPFFSSSFDRITRPFEWNGERSD